MNITKALQIIQDHPAGLSLGVTVLDDGIIVGAITLARDPMATLAKYHGPGPLRSVIVELAAALPNYEHESTFYMVHGMSDETP